MQGFSVELAPLERGYLAVLRLRALITWGILFAIAATAEIVLSTATPWPIGPAIAVVGVFGLFSITFGASRQWARWGYAFTGEELHIGHGWLTRVRTVVPVRRVQHIDVSEGPIERANGVSTLVLHTAGTEHSLVALPGITRARAEEIRDDIRGRLTPDLW